MQRFKEAVHAKVAVLLLQLSVDLWSADSRREKSYQLFYAKSYRSSKTAGMPFAWPFTCLGRIQSGRKQIADNGEGA